MQPNNLTNRNINFPARSTELKFLEDENTKLRKIVADLSLDREMLQDVIRRKL